MPVGVKAVVKYDKEMFVQFADGVDVREQDVHLGGGDYFGVEEEHLEVADDDAQVVDVFLFCED